MIRTLLALVLIIPLSLTTERWGISPLGNNHEPSKHWPDFELPHNTGMTQGYQPCED